MPRGTLLVEWVAQDSYILLYTYNFYYIYILYIRDSHYPTYLDISTYRNLSVYNRYYTVAYRSEVQSNVYLWWFCNG